MLSRCARFAPQVKRSKLHIVEAQGLIAKRFSGVSSSLEFWMMLRIQDWGSADAFTVRAHDSRSVPFGLSGFGWLDGGPDDAASCWEIAPP